MTQSARWHAANLNLVAKAIGELTFEQLLQPTPDTGGQDAQVRGYTLALSSGCSYRFRAWRTTWEQLRVEPSSIDRLPSAGGISAGTFFRDAQTELGLNDLVLGGFLEEMQSTLVADAHLLQLQNQHSVEALVNWDGLAVQNLLPGHPKFILNKGRLGWSLADWQKYAPECSNEFQLEWIAVQQDLCRVGKPSTLDLTDLLLQCMSLEDFQLAKVRLSAQVQTPEKFLLLPVHPWQWERILQLQFAGEIAQQKIVSLGRLGDLYRPQISVRTLSNRTRPQNCDVKLSLSVLNTSAIRGIPPKYIAMIPQVTDGLAQICAQDPLLQQQQATVLKDLAGISVLHPEFSNVPAAAYRYHESLGVIWRESAQSKLEQRETYTLAASLAYQDTQGQSLLSAHCRAANCSIETWLRRYFDHVVIPLYHLQCRYGLGLVAHGQNVVVRLRDHLPAGLFLKDFQGDLRKSTDAHLATHRQTACITDPFAGLDSLPPEHLIHDLVTGHFSTVLRFASATLQESENFPEAQFYSLLQSCVHQYLNQWPSPNSNVDLLRPHIERVLLNKVRFKIGYADSTERPLPALGDNLPNPIVASLSKGESAHA